MSFYEVDYKGKHYEIPDDAGESIEMYVKHGIPPGSFLTAIICNNLRDAFGQADRINAENIPAYVMYFYWEVPAHICGDPATMNHWIRACIEKRAKEAQVK